MPNPDHVKTEFILLDSRRCTECWACIKECPKGVIGKVRFLKHKHAYIDKANACVGCKKCIKACPNHAIMDLKNLELNNYSVLEWKEGSHRHVHQGRFHFILCV